MTVTYAESLPPVGSLVRVRGRDWVVLPGGEGDILRLRPLTGSESDAAGIYWPLERCAVQPAQFNPPNPDRAGDTIGALLLADAARLSIRNGATPFRSLGRIAVSPRPYQFVPLIMALRLDPVRLLIADDVGVGKTVEAGLIARELLDRGVASRLTVLCPPHLCEQWQSELRDKFGIEAAIVQPATIGRLERALPRQDLSIYQHYPHLIVSIDYAKTDRNRGAFLNNAADLVIVDEAHTAARPPGRGTATQHQRYSLLHSQVRDKAKRTTSATQHQRYSLLHRLAEDQKRHLLLVTATPHSGIEESFRSLLGLLNPAFDTDAPLVRRALLPHVVQRRRQDLQHWLGAVTPFPQRRSSEVAYALSPDYHRLFEDVLEYCRETIAAGDGRQRHQRVRHWAAIALLRCLLSSPAMAGAVLAERVRREGDGDQTFLDSIEAIDAAYRPQVLDPIEEGDSGDYTPAAPLRDAEPLLSESERRRLGAFLRRSRDLAGPRQDGKLAAAAETVSGLLAEGLHPIVFCRYIATAHYLKEWLPHLLERSHPAVRVDAVTGEIGDEERRVKVDDLATSQRRILVATDCLSEGINLQESFDAVLHYDLPWNPNRLEQREGRVDRFGQSRTEVRTTILYGADNPVDQVVLDVLIRKAREIRRELGISVPVPTESDGVVQAVVDTVLLHRGAARQMQLALNAPEVTHLHADWDKARDREASERTYFAQHGIQPDEVERELAAADPVLGDAATVQRFLTNAVQRLGGEMRPGPSHTWTLRPGPEMQQVLAESETLRPLLARHEAIEITTGPVAVSPALTVGRTHPLVTAYCETVLGRALDGEDDPTLARCGAIVTDAVSVRTGIALLRLRYSLRDVVEEYAEEVILAAFTRQDGTAQWLRPWEVARDLLQNAHPTANLHPVERADHVRWALGLLQAAACDDLVAWRVEHLSDANHRLRTLVHSHPLQIKPHRPPDILGMYVLVPGKVR